MTLNGVELDKPCDGDPAQARDVAAGYLIKLGYSLVERDDERIHLELSGRWFTTDPEEQTHHVHLSSAPGNLHFEFSTGLVASSWTEAHRRLADERAEAAARAARGAHEGGYRTSPSDLPMVACAYCGKINLTSAPRCSVCGAPPRRH